MCSLTKNGPEPKRAAWPPPPSPRHRRHPRRRRSARSVPAPRPRPPSPHDPWQQMLPGWYRPGTTGRADGRPRHEEVAVAVSSRPPVPSTSASGSSISSRAWGAAPTSASRGAGCRSATSGSGRPRGAPPPRGCASPTRPRAHSTSSCSRVSPARSGTRAPAPACTTGRLDRRHQGRHHEPPRRGLVDGGRGAVARGPLRRHDLRAGAERLHPRAVSTVVQPIFERWWAGATWPDGPGERLAPRAGGAHTGEAQRPAACPSSRSWPI